MKSFISFLVVICMLLTSVSSLSEETTRYFAGMDDPDLLPYIETEISNRIEAELANEDYEISVVARYESKEAIEEGLYNSKETDYFGYLRSELDIQFQGNPYIFTLDDDGTTIVKAFENYDDSWDRVLTNVAVGSGVILICVTVTVISGGVGATAVSAVFAASAKSAAIMAASSGSIGAVSAGIITGIQTKDFDSAIKAAALSGSNSFKWGAISGAIIGGASKAIELHTNATAIRTPAESEAAALKKYPGDAQRSYLDGKEVPYSTPNSTRPDIVRTVNDHLEAIEVKNVNLDSSSCISSLKQTLRREIPSRIQNMPRGTTQRIVFDIQGRGYSDKVLKNAIDSVRECLVDIYPDIPIDFI